ncbi:hypothetical protein HDV63DRAFT_211487 [Trichoderma sp. SZMC 28014]
MQHREESPDELALSPAPFVYGAGSSQVLSGVDPPISLPASSFTSSFSSSTRRFRRQRSPRSRITEGQASQTGSRGPGGSEQPNSTRGSVLAITNEAFRVRTYVKRDKLCFLDTQEQELETERKDWTEQKLDYGRKCFCWQSPGSGQVYWTRKLAAPSLIASSSKSWPFATQQYADIIGTIDFETGLEKRLPSLFTVFKCFLSHLSANELCLGHDELFFGNGWRSKVLMGRAMGSRSRPKI